MSMKFTQWLARKRYGAAPQNEYQGNDMNHKTGKDIGIHLKTTRPIKASLLQTAPLSSIQSQQKPMEQNIKAAKQQGHRVPGSCA